MWRDVPRRNLQMRIIPVHQLDSEQNTAWSQCMELERCCSALLSTEATAAVPS